MKKLIYLVAALCMAACGGEPAADLHVMTFNMRYDNPEDGEHNWRFRKERAAEAIVSRGIDLLGTQEVLANQFADLRELLPGYEAVGVGREDGAAQGEFNAVFWRADRFTLLDSGTFWLSETPETPGSKGWDGACERIATCSSSIRTSTMWARRRAARAWRCSRSASRRSGAGGP